MKALRMLFFVISLAYLLGFFPFMLFGKSIHHYNWDVAQTVLLIILWIMAGLCTWMFFPGKRGFFYNYQS